MIFTSYTYLVFLGIAFLIHWSTPERTRKPFLIVMSFLFYCSWKWQYGFLLLGISLFNWRYGLLLARRPSGALLTVGILVNLSALLYFKYSAFLVANASSVFGLMGGTWSPRIPEILLPLGISFFVFQGVAYLVDIAAGDEPFTNIVDFLLFKSFWPQLVAGPIIRVTEIREQIENRRTISYLAFAEGLQRILFGFFKKVVLADNIAPFVDMVFLPGAQPGFVDVAVGAVGFGLQIYFDFSAYSDIAIGSARLFGFSFPENFNWPYAAGSPQEFWNRWHMTLSRWIRDYIFVPLSFSSRANPNLLYLWTIVAMAGCGWWHGAKWSFVFWGIWHGLLLAGTQLLQKKEAFNAAKKSSSIRRVGAICLTFGLVTIGWVFFRADSATDAFQMLGVLLSAKGGIRPTVLRENAVLFIGIILMALFLAQWLNHLHKQLVPKPDVRGWSWVWRSFAYAGMICLIIISETEAKTFVYFQF